MSNSSFGVNNGSGNYPLYNLSPGEGYASVNMTNSLKNIINISFELYIQNLMLKLMAELIENILQPEPLEVDSPLADSNESRNGVTKSNK